MLEAVQALGAHWSLDRRCSTCGDGRELVPVRRGALGEHAALHRPRWLIPQPAEPESDRGPPVAGGHSVDELAEAAVLELRLEAR